MHSFLEELQNKHRTQLKQDILLLRRKPDAGVLKELEKMGFEIPEIICPAKEDEERTITELILEDKRVFTELREKARGCNICLVPYGVTDKEEALAKSCDMKIMGSTSAVTHRANSKLYAKQLIERRKRVFGLARGESVC